jgi:uncharacterized protein (DUF1800 family)
MSRRSAVVSSLIDHLFRRAGFGLTSTDRAVLVNRTYRDLVDGLLTFDPAASDALDAFIGTPGYVGISTTGPFTPNIDINQARQRWLFRMVHSPAPLQEKMALFWHNHFATAFSKISGLYNSVDATRMLAAKPSTDAAGQLGQIEMFRQYGLGKFKDLLVMVAQDPAMLVWLDGQTNTKTNPQENFGRELMELFTVGVEHYVETDVYAAARVFTGWNLQVTGTQGTGTASFAFAYRSAQHETSQKDFSFSIYNRGFGSPNSIPARSATDGMQDGLDLLHALAFHPETATRLATKLWTWFVSETDAPDPAFVTAVASAYLSNDTSMRATLRAVLTSPQFQDSANVFQRYSWPAEFVTRALKEVGFLGFSVGDALTPMVTMGQQLFEPPNVGGWDLGQAWFSTAGMLARMNFAAQLATNQKVALRDASRASGSSPDALIAFARSQLQTPVPLDAETAALETYLASGGPWTGSDAQLLIKTPGLFHLITGSAEFQFV